MREKADGYWQSFVLFLHQLFPLEEAEDGDDDVKGVEAGLEGNILVEVEDAGDDIDGNPYEPLFEIFVGQSPDAYKAEGGCKAVGQRHVAIGASHQ